jgi:hypothetical protein
VASDFLACVPDIITAYSRHEMPDERELEAILAGVDMPPRVPDAKQQHQSPVNHGRAMLFDTDRVNIEREHITAEIELQARRDSSNSLAMRELAKNTAEEAKRVKTAAAAGAKQEKKAAADEKKQAKLAVTAAKKAEVAPKKAVGGVRKRKEAEMQVTCSNTMGCRAVRDGNMAGNSADPWLACGVASCDAQFCGAELCGNVRAAHRRLAHGAN